MTRINFVRLVRVALAGVITIVIVCFVHKASASERQIAIIVKPHSYPKTLDRNELAAVFTRRLMVDSTGSPLNPVNLPISHPLRNAFSRAVLGLAPADMTEYWNESYFHGISPPHVVASVEAMRRFVASTAGAVGYVFDCQVDNRVSVIMTLHLAPGTHLPEDICTPDSDRATSSLRELQKEIAH